MALAYPGEKSTLADHIARDAFLVTLSDTDFELKIREREPASLDDALRIARRFEVFKGAAESRATGRHRLNRHVYVGCASEAYFVDVSRFTGPIFTVFLPYESALSADDRSGSYFPICQGTLP